MMEMKTMNRIKSSIQKIKSGWSTPPEGRFLPIKEIAAYGVGGMGLHFMFSLLSYAITAQMLPKMYGIKPTQATFLVTLVSIIQLLIMPWFYFVFDNSNSKRGKYRSFISFMAPLLALFSILSTFAPQFSHLENSQTIRAIYAFCTCVPVLIISHLLNNIYNMMPASMTPVSQERADMLSPASILYSFAPTVIGWVFNPLRGVFQAKGQEYLAYRYMGIIFAVSGLALSFILVFKTKERTYVVKKDTGKEKIGFIHGLKSVFQNKPFVFYTLSGLFATLKTLVDANVVYMYDYRLSEIVGNGPKISGLIIAVTGELATVTMIATPFIIRKLSKKWLMIITYSLSLVSYVVTAAIGFENIGIGTPSIIVCSVLRSISMLSAGCNVVLGPAMLADIYDYQQYKTNERLEGFMSTVTGYVGIIGMLLTMAISALQEKMGFMPNEAVFIPGDKLYDPEFVMPIFTNWMTTITWISAGAFLFSIIPLLFYNLTEKEHKECMKIVMQRTENTSEIEYEKNQVKENYTCQNDIANGENMNENRDKSKSERS